MPHQLTEAVADPGLVLQAIGCLEAAQGGAVGEGGLGLLEVS